ncbi:MAG: hypothetical protein E6789_08560 [Clostridium baratii]|nr:hypothetical protein [Clostridium baratii]
MRYKKLGNRLVKRFEELGFEELFKENKINSKSIEFKNDNNINLKIFFPGYKTSIYDDGNIKAYDYRVELGGVPISHVNIVVDLYNKIVQAPHLERLLKKFLIDLAQNGDKVELDKYEALKQYNFKCPNKALKEQVNKIHLKNRKKYLIEGNSKDLTLEQLRILIPTIVLQEDINYPMEKGFNGRRMSFYRYLEAVSGVNIDDVIVRTISHKRPALYNNLIDYSKIENLNKVYIGENI